MVIDQELLKRIEAKKRQLDKAGPLNKDIVHKLREQMAIELAYNSNAIEGSTLTLRETKLILEEGITIGGKSLREHLEAINHKEAFEWIEEEIKKKEAVSEKAILAIHKIIMKGISTTWAGKYREGNIRVLGALFKPAQPREIEEKMGVLVEELKKEKENSIERSAKAHYELVLIHPFVDGNGRTARLLNNILLMQEGYPPMIVLMNDRKKYYSCLRQADQGNIQPFINFIARNVERTLDIYLNAIATDEKREFISLQEATKYCPYSQEYLSLLARKGKIEAIKIQRNWVTTRKAIEEYNKKKRK